jgi:putative sterol carrier protein
MAQRSRDVIREAIQGKPDEDVMQLVQNMGGIDAVIEMVFEGMEDALVADKAQDAVIGWEICDGESEHDVTLTVKDKKASYDMRASTPTRVTLALSFTDFIRLISGDLSGSEAFTSGKLHIKGDVAFARQIPDMFGIA